VLPGYRGRGYLPGLRLLTEWASGQETSLGWSSAPSRATSPRKGPPQREASDSTAYEIAACAIGTVRSVTRFATRWSIHAISRLVPGARRQSAGQADEDVGQPVNRMSP
jgi:hypothetical protein